MSNALAALRASKGGSANQVVQEKEIHQAEPVYNRREMGNPRVMEEHYDRGVEVDYRRSEVHNPSIINHRAETPYIEERYERNAPAQYQPVGGLQEPRYQEVVQREEYMNPRYQDVRQIPVDRVPSQTDMVISKPDRFGLQILGLNSNDNIRIVKPRSIDIQPLVIQNITDVTGKVAMKLEDIMFKTGATVLPLRECGVFENITSISGFQIVDYKGKKYASYCGLNYPATYQDQLVNKIVSKLSSALNYGVIEGDFDSNVITWDRDESRLSKTVTISGKELEIPSLCVSELEYVCTKLKYYNCNVIEVVGDFPHLIVGIDLEGVDVNEGEYAYRR